MLPSIYSVLKPCFKQLNNTKLISLTKAIACVAFGLRTSHLIDIAHLDLEKAKSLLIKLRQSCRSLVLIQFKDRYTFICNKHRLRQYIHDTLNNHIKLLYIAVHEKEPVKLDVPPMQLVSWLQHHLLPFIISTDKQPVFYSSILPTCMVAITGWILEYPVIYTTHLPTDNPQDELDEWEQRSNCLGNQPLQLVEYYLSDHMLLSYSYPLLVVQVDEQQLKLRIDQRLDDIKSAPDWLNNIRCEIKREQIKLDRFAL